MPDPLISYTRGPRGPQGVQGPPGDTIVGSQGPQGSQGSLGCTGNQGPQGFQGSPGTNGTQGPQGSSTGTQGARGFQGFQGFQGTQGVRGFQGFQGTSGTQGFQGEQGESVVLTRSISEIIIPAASGTPVIGFIDLSRSCIIYSIESSSEAWFTLYSNDADRILDASRIRTTAPELNSGIIADPVFTSPQTIFLQPLLSAINIEDPVSVTFPFKLVNDGVSGNVTITIQYLTLEE